MNAITIEWKPIIVIHLDIYSTIFIAFIFWFFVNNHLSTLVNGNYTGLQLLFIVGFDPISMCLISHVLRSIEHIHSWMLLLLLLQFNLEVKMSSRFLFCVTKIRITAWYRCHNEIRYVYYHSHHNIVVTYLLYKLQKLNIFPF